MLPKCAHFFGAQPCLWLPGRKHDCMSCWDVQVYAQCLQLGYERWKGDQTSQDGEDSAANGFHELCLRVGAAHAGFLSNAADALGIIMRHGIEYVFAVGLPGHVWSDRT